MEFGLLFFLFLATSCSKDECDISRCLQLKEDFYSQSYLRSSQDAIDAAIDFLSSTQESAQSRSSYKVKTIDIFPKSSRSSESASLYVINFDEGGYALISADIRATTIYAFSESGSFDINDEYLGQYLLNEALSYEREEISSYNNGSNNTYALGNWINWSTVINHKGHQCRYYEQNMETVAPLYLCSTYWDQTSPFNDLCYTRTGLKAWAGCTAIAIGQIFAYHCNPTSYNGFSYDWSAINSTINNDENNSQKARLIHDIGVAINMTYRSINNHNNGSSASNYDVHQGFQLFGYSNTIKQYGELDEDLITNEISHNRPIYISSKSTTNEKSHAWVIDGVYHDNLVRTYYTYPENDFCSIVSIPTNYYFHCEWGWGGMENGWFLKGIFHTSGDSYGTNCTIMYNITQ